MRYFHLFILLMLISCHNVENKGNKVEENNFLNEERQKTTKLIFACIELPALQQYYRDEKPLKQKDLVILKNEFTKDLDTLNKFGNPVKILTINEIKERGIVEFLEFKQIKISNDSAFVYYRYDVQGVGIESTYIYKINQWVLLNSHSWEN
jgi:hypothetical protein